MALLPLQDGPVIQLIALAAYTVGTRVKLDAQGRAAVAAKGDRAIGYIDIATSVAGQLCYVRTISYPAMHYARAHAALETGDVLFAQDAGRVDDVDPTGSFVVGVAVDTALAQDDIIRIIRVDSTNQ